MTSETTGEVRVTENVLEGLEAVRESGLTNMIDVRNVAKIAFVMGFYEAGEFVESNRELYFRGVMEGFTDKTT